MAILRCIALIACAIAVAYGVYSLPLATQGNRPAGDEPTPDAILRVLNEQRAELGSNAPLARDPLLSDWLDAKLSHAGPAGPQFTASEILEHLQDEVGGIASASAGVFRTSLRGQPWIQELRRWQELQESAYTHLSASVIHDPAGKEATLWIVLAQRLPEFRPDLLAQGLQQFHHTCARCERGYNGQFFGGNRILLLQCPHCDQSYDILAMNTEGHFQRANTYFSHLTPPAAFRSGMSAYDKMTLIWKSVLDHCRYENDYDVKGLDPAKDSWQTSAETLQNRSGDCEDTSILLADWLISKGIEARVVIGETKALQGHAWCIARVDDSVYLLETTVDRDDALESPPLVDDLKDRYRPEYLFDREHLYFFTGARLQDPGNCWDQELWEAVAYASPPPSSQWTLSMKGEGLVESSQPWFNQGSLPTLSPVPVAGRSESVSYRNGVTNEPSVTHPQR